jgi:hypothetical protein
MHGLSPLSYVDVHKQIQSGDMELLVGESFMF